jgi:8-oxo-dGTP pyrophosphatase MutT (NUDIX family)
METKIATLLFLQRRNEILLAMKKRGFGAGRWNGVGGKVESGETIEQALVRECREEISVTPLVYHKVAEHEFTEFHDGAQKRMLVHIG